MDARVSIQGRKLIGKGCWDRFKISQEVCEYFEKLISSRKSTCIFLLEISE